MSKTPKGTNSGIPEFREFGIPWNSGIPKWNSYLATTLVERIRTAAAAAGAAAAVEAERLPTVPVEALYGCLEQFFFFFFMSGSLMMKFKRFPLCFCRGVPRGL